MPKVMSALVPPASASASLETLTLVGTGLYWLAEAFRTPNQSALQTAPELRALFLQNYSQYTQFFGDEGMALVYAVTDMNSKVINATFKARDVAAYLSPHLDVLRGGFHPIVHARANNKIKSLGVELASVSSSAKSLVTEYDKFHIQLDGFLRGMNTELSVLKTNGQAYENRNKDVITQWADYVEYMMDTRRMNVWLGWQKLSILAARGQMVKNQAHLLENPQFRALALQQIVDVVDTYKELAQNMVGQMSTLDMVWTQMADQADQLAREADGFKESLPDSLRVLSEIDLEHIGEDWKQLYNKAVAAEQALDQKPASSL